MNTSKRYSVGLAYPAALGIGAIIDKRIVYLWCNRSVITRCNLAVSEVPIRSSAKTHQIAYTYCSVGISDLKPLTGT